MTEPDPAPLPAPQVIPLNQWQPRILDLSKLPDIAQIKKRCMGETMDKHGNRRWLAAAIGAGALGLLTLVLNESVTDALIAGAFAGVCGWLGMWLILYTQGQQAARREIMPQVAAQCGATWVEDASSIAPEGHPLHKNGNRYGVDGGFSLSVGNFTLGDANDGRDGRHTYSDGMTGTLPGRDLPYGIFNYSITTSSGSGENRSTHTSEYIIAWLDLAMPVHALQVKRRFLQGGGMMGRMLDRFDTKVTDQRVLDTESEMFNRSWKVEVPDSSDEIVIRRMFSPKVLDAFGSGRVQLMDNIDYRDGRLWIVERSMGHFGPDNLGQCLDQMLYRAQMIATICQSLAREAGHNGEVRS